MSERKPMVLVLAGPNGSGKSTITRFFDTVGTYTNADDAALSGLCQVLLRYHMAQNGGQEPVKVSGKLIEKTFSALSEL